MKTTTSSSMVNTYTYVCVCVCFQGRVHSAGLGSSNPAHSTERTGLGWHLGGGLWALEHPARWEFCMSKALNQTEAGWSLSVDGDWARMSVSGAACLWNRPGHQAQEGCPGRQHFPRVVTYCCCRIKCRLCNSTGRGPPETGARFLLDSALPAFSLGWF